MVKRINFLTNKILGDGRMNELVKVYNDGSVELRVEFKMIDSQVYANANTMAESQKLADWKRSANTKRYIDALNSRKINGMENSHTSFIISESGSDTLNGTWIHEKLILNLARYISVDFELWADEQIATLIRDGEVNLTKPSYAIDNPIERAKRWIEEQELHQLEVKQKDEVIIKVKEEVKAKEKVIDDITKDVDTPLLCKTVTDYINILHHKTKEPHQVIYKKVYDVLGRRLSKDIPYRKAQYEQKQREMVIENIEYNKKHDLRGEDRRVPFKMKDAKSKISTLEYIVDVLGEGHALIETIAKLADVGIEDVIEKYNYYRSTNVDELM